MSSLHLETIEVPVAGMDCAECTQHVQKAISALPGVQNVEVFLTSEKAFIRLDPEVVNLTDIRKAVKQAGYQVPDLETELPQPEADPFTRSILRLLGVVFGLVLFVVVVGEWLGLFEEITSRIPMPIGVVIVLIAGYPVFLNVIKAAFRGQVISHTLMTVGVIAALLVGEWGTAVMVVFFMRIGDYVEHFTTERARQAVRDLASLAPRNARLEREDGELEVPIDQVSPGQIVIVRPGEKIPVDGFVLSGQGVVNQASITGESLPVDAGPGRHVYASTLLIQGSFRLQVEGVGAQTTFGRMIKLVEEAEAHRANVQRIADKFSAYYLPVVAAIAFLTYLVRRDPLATAAVLVVACSCSFALATPIAMLASIGAGAQRGLMVKGGKYLETLAKADVLLIDKTGTLTLGKPEVKSFRSASGGSSFIPGLNFAFPATDTRTASSENQEGLRSTAALEVLRLAASAERYSEHPLAAALREAAHTAGLDLAEPKAFESHPGFGVRAVVDGRSVMVGNEKLVNSTVTDPSLMVGMKQEAGKTGHSLLYVALDDELVGYFSAADTLRPEVPDALRQVRLLGIERIEILTGDNQQTAQVLLHALGGDLDIRLHADLLPEDKIRFVREYQEQGFVVAMIGDGVNDAPALAQADVGIALRSTAGSGSDLAVEAAHIVLMREDWYLVPAVIRIARRTMGVVKMNIGFTAVYNLVGLTLAALGYLPPVLAAAAQSIPDLGILANSSRLLHQKD